MVHVSKSLWIKISYNLKILQKGYNMSKIQIKFSLLIGILSFLVAMGIGKYANDTTTKAMEANSGEALIRIAEETTNILDREMLERYREIKFASELPQMRNETTPKEVKKEIIQKIRDSYNHHEWIGYALPDGTVDIGTNGYLEGKNVKARPWHPGGLQGPYIGDVHDALLLAKLIPNTSGEAIYFSDVAFPVKNYDNQVIGVLCTHLMWQWTRDVVKNVAKKNNVEIFLLSKDGLILTGPDKTERQNIADLSKEMVSFLTQTTPSYKVASWNNAERYLSAYAMSQGYGEYKGFGWKVIVRKNVNDAFKASNDLSSNILIVSVAIGLLGALIGILFASKISSPLSRLVNIVNDLKSHREDIEFSQTFSNDEIGNLEKAIKELYDAKQNEISLKNKAQQEVDIALKIFDQSIEGILISDKNNKTVLTNKSFTELSGYTPNEIYGKNPNILSSPNTPKEFYEKMWHEITTYGKWEGEIENKKKDGTLYKEHLKISTLKDDDGNILYYLSTFHSGF